MRSSTTLDLIVMPPRPSRNDVVQPLLVDPEFGGKLDSMVEAIQGPMQGLQQVGGEGSVAVVVGM